MAGKRHHAGLDHRRLARFARAVKDRAGWRCERCGAPGKLEAHHKQPLHRGGAPYALDNGECLCRGCHIRHHRGDDRRTPGRGAWLEFIEELAENV